MSVNWNYFNRFNPVLGSYMPDSGEGDTLASQIVTAVNKLVYKWYNDGDVFDNTAALSGWCNDLSSYANWLYYIPANSECMAILDRVYDCFNDSDYEDLLKELADLMLDGALLESYEKHPKVGSIYECEGKFRFEEVEDEEDDW